MIKKFYIVLLLLFGFLVMPTDSYACGVKSEKACCKKENTTKSKKMSCCSGEQKSDKDEKGCDGSCGHSECGCTSTSTASSFIFLGLLNSTNSVCDFSTQKKMLFSYNTPSLSEGFTSIWLIPKIS